MGLSQKNRVLISLFIGMFFVFASCSDDSRNSRENFVISATLPPLGITRTNLEAYLFTSIDGDGIYHVENNQSQMMEEWTLSVKGDRLNWFVKNLFSNEISPENFNRLMIDVQAYVRDISEYLGEPRLTSTGLLNFIDPVDVQISSYPIMSVHWEKDSKEINLNFSLSGTGQQLKYRISLEAKDQKA